MKPAIALVLLLLIASTFSATTQDRDFISGLDTVSCDGWIANKRIDPAEAVRLMDEYCTERPSTLVTVAAGAVVDKLGTVRTLAHP
jgi:hypothetical protein